MLSTGAMVKLGKVYQNLMVDVKATNVKLVDRACRIVVEATGAERAQAEAALAQTGFEVKPAILMILAGVSAEGAAAAAAARRLPARGAGALIHGGGGDGQDNGIGDTDPAGVGRG